jgi:hypothetical protein
MVAVGYDRRRKPVAPRSVRGNWQYQIKSRLVSRSVE